MLALSRCDTNCVVVREQPLVGHLATMWGSSICAGPHACACVRAQIVMNAISNAVKYTPPGSTEGVTVTATLDAVSDHIVVDVTDCGPGLRGQSLAELVNEFGGTPNTRGGGAIRSSGMGIPICVRLAELMGGSVALGDRPDLASGARFTLRLPLHYVPPPPRSGSAQPASPVLELAVAGGGGGSGGGGGGGGGSANYYMSPGGAPQWREAAALRSPVASPLRSPGAKAAVQRPHSASAAPRRVVRVPGRPVVAAVVAAADAHAKAPAADAVSPGTNGALSPPQLPRDLAGTRVLVVDDSPANLRFAVFVLRRLGCAVDTATDGDEVVAAAATAVAAGAPFDVCVMDLYMVRVNGDAALAALRAAAHAFPVLLCTANATSADTGRCATLGFAGTLGKPFTPEQMRAAVAAALSTGRH